MMPKWATQVTREISKLERNGEKNSISLWA